MSFTSTKFSFFFSSCHFSTYPFIYSACYSYLAITNEESKATANPTMTKAPVSVAPATLNPAGPGNVLTLIPSSIKTLVIAFVSFLHLFLTGSSYALCFLSGSSLVEVAPTSQFEISSSYATVFDPMNEATSFFNRFDQVKINALDPTDFWDAKSPYVDLHGFWVLEKCVTHLEAVYSSSKDFM